MSEQQSGLNEYLVQPVGPLFASVRPPGSKSITNRALVCAALADGRSQLSGALDSEDTQVMVDSLRRLGLPVVVDPDAATIELTGSGGSWPQNAADLYVANSGTTIRFLTAMVAIGQGRYRLDGVPRMRQRPIGDLINSLQKLGVDCRSELQNDCPPVVVHATGLPGGPTTIRGSISSQFLSGLLMAAPYARDTITITIDGEMVSQPYVDMTLRVMQAFGVHVEIAARDRYVIPSGQRYQGRAYAIEPDASAASYFWGAAAVTGGRITVQGLARDALQGDVAFCDCLAQMGCDVEYSADQITVTGRPLQGITVNMNAISDTVQTLAVVALFATGPTTITGVGHIRHKETDRIGDLARELRKLGAQVDEWDDGLRVTPGALHGASIATYHDHRMAMSLALAGLRVPGVVIQDPACVNKTYPHYFTDLEGLAAARMDASRHSI
ncbi:MAG: 3-phosphoshikimate 1-carboxyvinyltransferase [Planctomycetota bacterium]